MTEIAPEVCQAQALKRSPFGGHAASGSETSSSGWQRNEPQVPLAQIWKTPDVDLVHGTAQTNTSTSASDVNGLLGASNVRSLETFNPLSDGFDGSSFTPSVPRVPATSGRDVLPQMPGGIAHLDSFIAMLNNNEVDFVGGTSSEPIDTAHDGRLNGMIGEMDGLDMDSLDMVGLDFSCMAAGTDGSKFGGTPGADFLGNTGDDNISGLHIPVHTNREPNVLGSTGIVTEPWVNNSLSCNKTGKPTSGTAMLDGLFKGISLSSLLSSSSGYTPSLPARFGPSPPGALSPARSMASITAPLDVPGSPSTNDDSVTLMGTDIHDIGSVSATPSNVEDLEVPQSPEPEVMLNAPSMLSMIPLGDNEGDRHIYKDPAPTGKENIWPLRDRKSTHRANGPDWHDKTKTELLSEDLSSDWEDFITKWHEFEGMLTTNDVSKISSSIP